MLRRKWRLQRPCFLLFFSTSALRIHVLNGTYHTDPPHFQVSLFIFPFFFSLSLCLSRSVCLCLCLSACLPACLPVCLSLSLCLSLRILVYVVSPIFICWVIFSVLFHLHAWTCFCFYSHFCFFVLNMLMNWYLAQFCICLKPLCMSV